MGPTGRQLLPAPFLHVQKALAERIGPRLEIIARKLVAVPQAIVHTIHAGAFQNGTGGAQQSFLSFDLPGGFGTFPGTAGGADFHELQFAHVAMNAASTGRHEVLLGAEVSLLSRKREGIGAFRVSRKIPFPDSIKFVWTSLPGMDSFRRSRIPEACLEARASPALHGAL